MSRLSEIEERLSHSWKALLDQWRVACDQWNDPVQNRFEQEIWSEFQQRVPEFIRELHDLNQLFQQARREVG
jgi:hypothetical protein